MYMDPNAETNPELQDLYIDYDQIKQDYNKAHPDRVIHDKDLGRVLLNPDVSDLSPCEQQSLQIMGPRIFPDALKEIREETTFIDELQWKESDTEANKE